MNIYDGTEGKAVKMRFDNLTIGIIFLLILWTVTTVLSFLIPFFITDQFRNHKLSKFIPPLIQLILFVLFCIPGYIFVDYGYSEWLVLMCVFFLPISFSLLLIVSILFIFINKKK
ncbi:MAG: hypothetical protein BGN88_04815 [Clostridiales bacterium 43-6]|nr:MAG: hypothetical protein BGN88_04815 [Clostridiales bacterium 43-6]